MNWKLFLIIILALVVVINVSGVNAYWNTDWSNRKTINFTDQFSIPRPDEVVILNLSADSNINAASAAIKFTDVRITTNINGIEVEVPSEIVNGTVVYDGHGSTNHWYVVFTANLSMIPNSNYFLYYNNPAAITRPTYSTNQRINETTVIGYGSDCLFKINNMRLNFSLCTGGGGATMAGIRNLTDNFNNINIAHVTYGIDGIRDTNGEAWYVITGNITRTYEGQTLRRYDINITKDASTFIHVYYTFYFNTSRWDVRIEDQLISGIDNFVNEFNPNTPFRLAQRNGTTTPINTDGNFNISYAVFINATSAWVSSLAWELTEPNHTINLNPTANLWTTNPNADWKHNLTIKQNYENPNNFGYTNNITSAKKLYYPVKSVLYDSFTFSKPTEIYNNRSYTTDSQRFSLIFNLSTLITSAIGTLNYNGTSNIATVTHTGNIWNLSADIITSNINNGNSDNVTFYWNYTVLSGTENLTSNTTAKQQQIYNIKILENSTTYNGLPTLFFEIWDEGNQSKIANWSFTAFEAWFTSVGVSGHTVSKNFSFTNSSYKTYAFNIFPEFANYLVNADITYGSTGYSTRTYHLQNFAISNVSQIIKLYLANDTGTSEIQFTIQDGSNIPLPGTFLQIDLKDIGSGEYQSLTKIETDANGQAITQLRKGTAYTYRLRVYDTDGTSIIKTVEPVTFTSTQSTYTITVGGETKFDPTTSLSCSCSYDNSTSTFTCNIKDSSGEVSQYRFVMKKRNKTLHTLDTVSDQISNSTANSYSTFTYTIADKTSDHFYVLYYRLGDDTWYATECSGQVGIGVTKPAIGDTGLFIVLILMFVMAMLGLYHPAIPIIMVPISLAISVWMGIFAMSTEAIVSITLVAGIIIVLMIMKER